MAGQKLGLRDVYVAAMLTDSYTAAPTWDTPAKVAGAVVLTANPNAGNYTAWGDDRAFLNLNYRGNLAVSAEFIDADPAVIAAMLGQTRANGITEEKAVDQSVYYAMGGKIWYGADVFGYVWYLKGKFAAIEGDYETYKGSYSGKNIKLSGEFISLMYNGNMSCGGRTDYSLSASAASAWFSQVVYVSSQSLTAVTVGSASGSQSAHTISIPFAKSGETFSVIAPTDDSAVTVSVVSTGLIVAGTYTYTASVAGTAPTLTIYNVNITNVPYIVTVTSRLVDSNGVHVTAKSQLVTPA